MTTANLSVAKEILNQLGGNRFIAMTGAKQFMASETRLQFKLPANFATAGINVVIVKLTPADTYEIEYGKLRGCKYTVIETQEDVYVDSIRECFTSATGLDCTMRQDADA